MRKRLMRAVGGPSSPSPEEIAQQVAQQLQQGANPIDLAAYLAQMGMQPEMVIQILMQAGLPQDQAMQAVQAVAQEVQGQGQQPQNTDSENPADNPEEANPEGSPGDIMALGGPTKSELGYRAPLDGSTMKTDQQSGFALFPNKYGDKNYFAENYNNLRTQLENSYAENPYYVDADGNRIEKNIDPDVAFGNMAEYVSMRESARRAREFNQNNRRNNLGYQKIQRDAFFNPNGLKEAPVATFEAGGDFNKAFIKELDTKLSNPDGTSESYINDRFNLFAEAVRRNFAKHTLVNGSQENSNVMSSGGSLPKASMGAVVYSDGSGVDWNNPRIGQKIRIGNAGPESVLTQAHVDYYRSKGSNQPIQYYNPNGNVVQFSGYADPRYMTPYVTPFGRLLQQGFNPYNSRLIKVQNPDNINFGAVLNGTDPNFELSNIETFRKGLFRRGVRYNFAHKDTQQGVIGNNGAQEEMVEMNGQMVPLSWAEENYRNPIIGPDNASKPSVFSNEKMISVNGQMLPLSEVEKNYRNPIDTVPVMDPENKPADYKPVPFAQDGIELTYGKQFNSSDVADVMKNFADRVSQFMNNGNYDPQREIAFYSAMNTQSDQLNDRGLYDQQGNFMPYKIGNQVLNPTNSFGDNSRAITMADGGSVSFTPEELAILKKAGYSLK